MYKADKTYLKSLKERLTFELKDVNASIALSEGDENESKEALSYCLEKALKGIQATFNCLTLIDIQGSIENEADNKEFQLDTH